MKLIKAEIVGFGAYENTTIHFAPGLQLLFGNNEAGKSTLYQFIWTNLFGFAKKSKNQRDFTPKSGARFGGHLYLETTLGTVKLSRFKDEKNPTITILESGETLDERAFKKIIAPLTADVFANVFSFQQEQMQEWQSVSEDTLQNLLLSLGLTGSENFLKLSTTWENDYKNIYLKTGNKPPLNQAVAEYTRLQDNVFLQQQKEASYQHLLQQRATLAADEKQLTEDLADLQIKVTQTKQTALAKPLLKEWAEVKDAAAPLLSESEEQELNRLFAEAQSLQEQRQALEMELNQQTGLKKQTSTDYFWYQEHLPEIKEVLADKNSLQADQTQLTELSATINVQQQRQKQLQDLYHFSTERLPDPLSAEQKKILAQSLADYQQLKQKAAKLDAKKVMNARKKTAVIVLILAFIGLAFFRPIWAVVVAVILGIGLFAYWEKTRSRTNPKSAQKISLVQYERDFAAIKKNLALGDVPLSLLLEDDNPVTEFVHLAQVVKQLKEQAQAVASKNQNCQQHWQQLFTFLTPGSLNDNFAQIEKFVNEMEHITFAKAQAGAHHLEEKIYELRQNSLALEKKAQPLLDKVQLTSLTQALSAIQMNAIARQKLARRTILAEQLQKLNYREHVFYDENELLETQTKKRAELATTQKTQQEVIVAIETLVADGTLPVLEQKLADQQAKIMELAKDWAQKKVATSLLQDLAKELSEQQLPHLLQLVGTYFAKLTDQHYRRIVLKQDNIQVQRADGLLFQLKDLSSGTRDQLFIAFRLAFLTLQGKNFAAPVIIDDGWLHYDKKRKQTFAEILLTLSDQAQIILLSSDSEMREIFERRGLSYQNLGVNQ